MKRFYVAIFAFVSLYFSGCVSGIEYSVTSNKINPYKDDYIYYTPHNIRVVGVFKDTKENEQKISKIMKHIWDFYKGIEKNNIHYEIKTVHPKEKDVIRKCKQLVLTGRYGYYRNLNERNDLIYNCFDRNINKNYKKKFYTGMKLKVINKTINISKADNNGDLHSTKIAVKTQKKDGYIIVYIQGAVKDYLTGYFIFLNNKLIDEFKKFNLKNQLKKVRISFNK